MNGIHTFLFEQFTSWRPRAPEVVSRSRNYITLSWDLEQFAFISDSLLYRLEKNNKLPKWIVVYSGGKTTKTIYDLPPSHPHKFRLKVILKGDVIPHLAIKALQHYGDERAIYKAFQKTVEIHEEDEPSDENLIGVIETVDKADENIHIDGKDQGTNTGLNQNGGGDVKIENECIDNNTGVAVSENVKWLESMWSEETWTSTDTDGTSAVCFSMAVKCGYIKQMQSMLDERPDLIGIINTNNGFTPLATAVRKGDVNTVKFLVSLGAEVDQQSTTGQTPLHLALLAGDINIVELLLEKGADIKVCDWNGLRAEHYAVDSCNVDMVRVIFDAGGDVHVRDSNGWTPLFRALCQGAKTEMVVELVSRGSNLETVDNAGLPLTSVARLMKNRHGVPRESVLRLVDSTYPHEKARSHFTRITRKIHNLQQLLNLI